MGDSKLKLKYYEWRLAVRIAIGKITGLLFEPLIKWLMRRPRGRQAFKYLDIKICILIVRDQLKELLNASCPKPEDREHIILLSLELIHLRRVERGDVSLAEDDYITEHRSARRREAGLRKMGRYIEVYRQRREKR